MPLQTAVDGTLRSILQKKAKASDGENGSQVWNKWEILPVCVVNHVRSLFPNPPNIPYMGHKWN